jgi:hypothetical protein
LRASGIVRSASPGGRLVCADIGLAVEPGTGDLGCAGDGLEGDRGAGVVQFTERPDGLGAGEFVTPSGGGDQVLGVVSRAFRTLAPMSWATLALTALPACCMIRVRSSDVTAAEQVVRKACPQTWPWSIRRTLQDSDRVNRQISRRTSVLAQSAGPPALVRLDNQSRTISWCFSILQSVLFSGLGELLMKTLWMGTWPIGPCRQLKPDLVRDC